MEEKVPSASERAMAIQTALFHIISWQQILWISDIEKYLIPLYLLLPEVMNDMNGGRHPRQYPSQKKIACLHLVIFGWKEVHSNKENNSSSKSYLKWMQKLSTQSWFKALSRNALFDFQFECQQKSNLRFNKNEDALDTRRESNLEQISYGLWELFRLFVSKLYYDTINCGGFCCNTFVLAWVKKYMGGCHWPS